LIRVPVTGGEPQAIRSDLDSTVGFAPDGDRFAFIRTVPGTASVIVTRLSDPSEATILERHSPDGILRGGPAWSPDGSRIVVVTYKSRNESAYRMTLTSVNVRDKTAEALSSEFRALGRAAWVRGGIAVTGSRENEPNQVLLFWPPNRVGMPLTSDLSSFSDGTATADGRTLVSVRTSNRSWLSFALVGATAPEIQRWNVSAGQSGTERLRGVRWLDDDRLVASIESPARASLWTISRSRGGREQLTSGESRDLYAAPCGSGAIVYVSQRANDWDIWRMDLRTKLATRVTTGAGDPTLPQCTADGTTVIFRAMRNGVRTLWSVPSARGTMRQLTQNISENPALSPDGMWIVSQYSAERASGTWAVALFPVSGGTPVRTFEGVEPNSLLRWHPRRQGFTWVRMRAGVAEFWTQPIQGGAPTKEMAVAERGSVVDFDWSPDGRTLAYLTRIADSDAVAFQLR
jgi:Tol biopolymer transport system component